jgi:hypothetical protein
MLTIIINVVSELQTREGKSLSLLEAKLLGTSVEEALRLSVSNDLPPAAEVPPPTGRGTPRLTV